jgi:hypothetical protein
MMEPDRVLEAVAIARRIGGGRLGPIDTQQVAQLGGEGLEVGALGGAGLGPARDEGLDPIVRYDFGSVQFHGSVRWFDLSRWARALTTLRIRVLRESSTP